MKKSILFALVLSLTGMIFGQEAVLSLKQTGVYSCGKQPKQVVVSPDGKYVVMPLLEDNGFDIFSMAEKKVLRRVNPPSAAKLGFAEGLFIPEKNAFFVSQMTTANIYEYSYPGFEYKRTINTKGNWSKFIAYCPQKDLLAVSNWISNDVSLIDYSTGKVVRLIKTGKAPRGMVFTDNGKYIISLSFDSGIIEKFEVETGKRVNSIYIKNAAMRHIVMNKAQTKAYISNMYHAMIYELDLSTFTITKQTKVYVNPNTIELYDDRYLFVSSRGYNNPEDYTKRSPANGRITVIDTTTMKAIKVFEGGNQPTGLAICNDRLIFSNFQDADIEVWEISK